MLPVEDAVNMVTFRRGLILNALLPAALLVASVGVDIYQTLALRSSMASQASAKTEFPKPGPRRYPPGYQSKAAALPPH
jgi:hypothetical protein